MQIVKDMDLIWFTDDYDVILVGTSVYNLMTQGFQSKMAVKYPDMKLEDANNSTPYADMRKLGKRITIEGKPTVSLMYICGYPHSKRDYLSYEGLRNCLESANSEFKGKRVATTLLGTSRFDGNGDRDRCIEIIEECTPNLDITVYDYEQKRKRDEIKEVYQSFNEIAHLGMWDLYYKFVSNKDKIIKNYYLRY